jgi:hypothetical protein
MPAAKLAELSVESLVNLLKEEGQTMIDPKCLVAHVAEYVAVKQQTPSNG